MAVGGRQDVTPPTVTSGQLSATDTTVTVNWVGTGDVITGNWEVQINSDGWEGAGQGDRGTHTFYNLEPNTNYTVSIRAYEEEGVYGSVWRAQVRTQQALRPGAPTLSTSVSTTDIGMTWTPSTEGSPPTSWEVRLDDGAWITKIQSARSHTFGGQTAASQHTVYLRGSNAGGDTPIVSANVQLNGTTDAPLAPTGLTLTAGDNTIGAAWTATTGSQPAAKWQFKADRTSGADRLDGEWTDIPGGWEPRRYTVLNLRPGEDHRISIRGVNDSGNGAAAMASARTLFVTGAPNAPLFTASAVSPTRVNCFFWPTGGGSINSYNLTLLPENIFNSISTQTTVEFSDVTSRTG